MAGQGARKLFGRFSHGDRVLAGEVVGEKVYELEAESLLQLMTGRTRRSSEVHELCELRPLAPIERPPKIICIGLNYRGHIKEMGVDIPRVPIIFTKPSSAIIGPGEEIVMPDVSKRVDYEGESAIVIGKRASHVKDGAAYIFGYTCFNDVTARDLQKTDVDWTRAKGFDTFASSGPFVSTTAPSRVTTRLNGRVVQDSSLADRVFGDAALVEYISTIMTLEPGDLIPTGTPSGISPMSPGDIVEVELDTVGTLRNKVIKSL